MNENNISTGMSSRSYTQNGFYYDISIFSTPNYTEGKDPRRLLREQLRIIKDAKHALEQHRKAVKAQLDLLED